jgi:hypothetical protein
MEAVRFSETPANSYQIIQLNVPKHSQLTDLLTGSGAVAFLEDDRLIQTSHESVQPEPLISQQG